MNYDLIVVRLGEVTIKGRNRGRFEGLMMSRIREALAKWPALAFERGYGRVYIRLNGESFEEIKDRLKDVFGLHSFSPAVRTGHDLEDIRAGALAVIRELKPAPQTFKVTVKRAWKAYPHDSQEMNHLIGAHVLRQTPNLKVDVHHPDVELKADIQPEGVYLTCGAIPGAGGFPLGMNGKAMLLLSGGIDSPVAGWLTMRKGLEIEAVHFHSYPYTSEQATEKVVTLTQRLAHYGGRIKLHLVPFTELQTRMAQSGHDHLIITLMRRTMLRIAERLAEKSGALALVTGDSLGQVASQTLGSMNVIGRTVSMPLLRPLVMMDKQEIIEIAGRIGTFETSILPYEDCCTLFVPKSPATNPNLRIVEKAERMLGGELERLIDEAVNGTETIVMTSKGRATGGGAPKPMAEQRKQADSGEIGRPAGTDGAAEPEGAPASSSEDRWF
ncbi:tRNA uracil 4-sulfurtransferase ThiI [Cohnella zeiphila]|uniref:Probable tRNA sulfurtransferase n=1 Tax=Cohnella zeiphila TaxID=2761120 RepID=A0A7X0VTB1_9BACL|nr:tRNA uracil 4-sulfurtransferase ThiI [Cohnella zeiphila]MBB6729684.1 tRNA 4-thiouridine(8) synthase ThiI [Cohnella zeiphila]